MTGYHIQEEGSISNQAEIGFGNEFGELEMVGVLISIKEVGISPVWDIGTGGTISTGFGVLHDGIVYFGACDHILYAIFAENGQEKWRFKTNDILMSKPCVANDTVYFGSFDGNLYALDLEGGERWRFPVSSKINSAIKHAEGRLFFGTEDGKFYCVSTEGKPLWSFATNGSIVENGAVGDNVIVFGSWDMNIYALDFDGRLLWKFSTKSEVNIDPAISDGVAYAGSSDKNVYALELSTGKELWRFRNNGPIRGITISGDTILFTSYTNKLVALDKTGLLKWEFKMDSYMVEPPVVHDGVIYAGSTDNNLYALDMDGKMLWKFPTKHYVVNTPVIWKNRAIFGSNDCNVYCVDLDGKLVWKFRTSMSNISKFDTESHARRKKNVFTLEPQAVSVEDKSYKTKASAAENGDLGQYTVETGYTTSISKYTKGMGKYGK
jgi:outer membrane protein assembly factor BamB